MHRSLVLVAGLILFGAFSQPSAAATNVAVALWDSGADAPMMDGMGYGMTGADQSMAKMGLKLSRDRVPAGPVTFNVINNSKDTVHEMIVVPVPSAGQPLPYVAAEDRIDEDAAGHLGEVSELDPGKSGSLTLDLTPGKYLVLCNIPHHFMAGMWKLLTVTP
jgi:uncharacterized cupredoxin-like copper-binding protein